MSPFLKAPFRTMILTAVIVCSLLELSHAEETPLHELIDQQIDAGLQERMLPAAERSSDAEFVRRIFLDLTGTIPDGKTARMFIEDSDPEKRTKLIDSLLESKAFALHMATQFDVTLMERRPDTHVTTDEWREYLTRSFAANKPLNVLAAEILGTDGGEEDLYPATKFFLDRAVEKDTLVRDIGRLFLGVDLQCAQCHDHPDIDDYLHVHYHGLSVFVAGTKKFKQPDGKMGLEEVVLREVEFASVFTPSEMNKTGPRLLDAVLDVPEFPAGEEYVEKPSKTVRSVPKYSLRKLLAEKLPSGETPAFNRNMANRLWALMMGRGIVHPLDMHHADNPPSHPELLQLLAARLASTNYDCKVFLRECALSKTYQRSSLLPEGIAPDQVPEASFAVANMTGLTSEQLFASLIVATKAEKILDQQIDDALEESASPSGGEPLDPEKVEEARRKKRAERVTEFVTIFGSAPGQPEGEFSAALAQALFLANSEFIAALVTPRLGNFTEQLMEMSDPNVLAEELYLNLMSRLPSAEERQQVREYLDVSEEERGKAVAALAWSLLASAEFRLRH